ncbi:MAG: RHS repeat-associated core domain-containing protein [Bdellovibrionaceae bacterium]|nr:RHS repeat-associated core domain-containing protein [Pseudobdellovibrionaceae bacterium]
MNNSGNPVSRFVWGDRNVPEYVRKNSVNYRLVTDPRGSVRLVLNSATGSVTQRLDYDEWGRVTADSNSGFQPFAFAGGLYDHRTGLVQFGARHYDARVGRWISKDPIGFEGGDTNLYGYVLNDPVNGIDTNGLFPKNVDEAGECIWGNPLGILENRELNIRLNQKRMDWLKRQLNNKNVCEDKAHIQKMIDFLESRNVEYRNDIQNIRDKCSGFYSGGL